MLAWQLLTAGLTATCIALVLFGARRLPSPRLSQPVVGITLTFALWAIGDLLTGSPRDMETEQLGIAILYTGSIFHAPLWCLLAVRWAESIGHPAWPPARNRHLSLAFAWAGANWVVMLTNPWHGWLLTPVMGAQNEYGPAFAVLIAGNTALSMLGTGVILRATLRSRGPRVRRQGAAMVAAGMVLLVGCWVYVGFGEPVPHTTLVVLGASGALLVLGMYRERLFGLLPTVLPVIFENDPDALLVVAPDGQLLHSNPRARELFAPTPLEPDVRIPDAILTYVHRGAGRVLGGDAENWRDQWWKAVERSEGVLCQRDLAARRSWLLLTAHDVVTRGGRLVARTLRAQDVTTQVEAQEELQRTRRLNSVAELASGVSHDFNNLLGAVRGHAEILLEGAAEHPTLARRAAKILRVSQRASELAQQLQLYAGGSEPSREPVAINDMVLEIADVIEPRPGPQTSLVARVGDVPEVRADPTQLRQVLANLVLNAREALDETGGEVCVSTGVRYLEPAKMRGLISGHDAPAGEYVFVRVSDDGPGLDRRVVDRVFEPYVSTKGKSRGTGLSTVLGIARAHRAPLAVDSDSGQGASFTLYLGVDS